MECLSKILHYSLYIYLFKKHLPYVRNIKMKQGDYTNLRTSIKIPECKL